jgi:hypothetical protein
MGGDSILLRLPCALALAVLLGAPAAHADGVPPPPLPDDDEDEPSEDLEDLDERPMLPTFLAAVRFSPHAGDSLNTDFGFGGSFTVLPVPFVGVEVHALGHPTSGFANSSDLASAISRLTPGQAVESLDPALSFDVTAQFVPVSGYIAPPGAPAAAIDFLVGVGGGFQVVQIEKLALNIDGSALVYYDTDPVVDSVRGGFHGLLGARLRPHPNVGFRVDARLLVGADEALDYSTPQNASDNKDNPALRAGTRLACEDPSTGAICALEAFTSFTFEFAAEFRFGPGTQ